MNIWQQTQIHTYYIHTYIYIRTDHRRTSHRHRYIHTQTPRYTNRNYIDTQTRNTHTETQNTDTHTQTTNTHTNTYTHIQCNRCRGDINKAMLAAKTKLQIKGNIKINIYYKIGPFRLW